MLSAACLCGFTELADETLVDHLERVFTPADMRGTDGQVHQETDALACGCGFTASGPPSLDAHFLAVFTPADSIGRDGKKHAAPAAGQ
ncbi:MAG TPA: hypothetical protein VH478_19640 [Trebonia sp.]|jgi:hypothetical protein|nr:hypothetical protein [Trebonia sp.]